ncbi:MAG: ABC transporter substrate-binding protein [Actinobacteria bacterium]|nr:ABC transporter substrate-binding protein [Actinomycetota bacterium]
MKHKKLVGFAAAAALVLAACGGDDSSSDTTAAPADGGAVGTNLADVCPAKIVLQTDWNPEAEHGFLYELIGAGYEVDTEKLAVRGDLVSEGQTTGVQVEVRAGGPAIGFQAVSSQMYQDPDIMLGFTSTDESVSNSVKFPTKAVVAPFNINPQIIMWDPATYPDVKTIKDLGATGAKVRYFDGAAYMEYLIADGQLSKDQVDGTYDGSPASFIAAAGKDAQQGFGTSEPFSYENDIKDWLKPVAYQYIHDAGWTSYAQSLGGTPESLEKNAECLKKFVPVVQKAQRDYIASPARTNALIIDAVLKYNNGWNYSAAQADAAVVKMLEDKLVANSPDGTLGSFDLDRITAFIAAATPVYEKTGSEVKSGITAADVVTNEYIDPSITLG